MTFTLEIPQIIYCVMFIIALGINAIYHKQTKKVVFNFWTTLFAVGVEIALLVWGGFFG